MFFLRAEIFRAAPVGLHSHFKQSCFWLVSYIRVNVHQTWSGCLSVSWQFHGNSADFSGVCSQCLVKTANFCTFPDIWCLPSVRWNLTCVFFDFVYGCLSNCSGLVEDMLEDILFKWLCKNFICSDVPVPRRFRKKKTRKLKIKFCPLKVRNNYLCTWDSPVKAILPWILQSFMCYLLLQHGETMAN